ncbi:MAG: hypothetical protein IH983_00295 [Planctomycetes bacterium]|nr:hypothetical protein [Planctomycetota bacterium]
MRQRAFMEASTMVRNTLTTWRLTAAIVSALLLGASAEAEEARQIVLKRLLNVSNVVFAGEVVRVDEVSFPDVPAMSPTVVMRIDAVFEKGEIEALEQGDFVTVEAHGLNLLRQGVYATVFALSWIVGDGIAVREVSSEIHLKQLAADDIQRLGTEIRAAQEHLQMDRLRAHIRAADIIVVGRVAEVRSPLMAAGAERRPMRITEHDPYWQEAVITVEKKLKGAAQMERVVVRFPSSIDVMWHAVPKLKQGQEGTFLLRADKRTGLPRMAMLQGAEVTAFTALDKLSVLSKADSRRVEDLLKQ